MSKIHVNNWHDFANKCNRKVAANVELRD